MPKNKKDVMLEASLMMVRNELEQKTGKVVASKSKPKNQDEFLKKIKSKKKEQSLNGVDIFKLNRTNKFDKEINIDAVIEVVKKKLWNSPRSLKLINVMLASYILQRNYSKAGLELKKGLNIDSNDLDINYNGAELLFKIGEINRAKELLKNIISKYKDKEALYFLGMILYLEGNKEQAIVVIAESLKDDSNVTRVDKNFAFLFIIKEDVEKELEILSKSLKRVVGNLDFRIVKSYYEILTGKLEKNDANEKIIMKLIAEDKKYLPCLKVNMGLKAKKSGDLKEAVENYNQAIKQNPKCICAKLEKIDIYLEESKYEKAGEILETIIKSNGKYLPVLQRALEFEFYSKNQSETEKIARKIVKIKKDSLIEVYNKEKIILKLSLNDIIEGFYGKLKIILDKYRDLNPKFRFLGYSEMATYKLFRNIKLCEIDFYKEGFVK
ncbi:tetratricopeptide repeat protein [Haliovirga abyssi]|uniref:Tetratricopeptide repeat protein n=1 Tax=Haliovirga abyssi TaxID=2996794 RepID=A0AAU9D4T8_9FUSO|nr:tetratricopeptide repeat protein [Haliovirga abyssi]BDU49563.1 hypothetical protein HLVA_01320 [Haliovirga abyssi]